MYLQNDSLVLVAINPRDWSWSPFRRFAEWNWISLRTDFYRPSFEFIPGLHDFGHSYTFFAYQRNHTQFLFPRLSELYSLSIGQFCGLSMENPWVYHNFYGTRLRSEKDVASTDHPVEIPFEALQVFFRDVLENQPRSVSYYASRVEQAAAAIMAAASTPTPRPLASSSNFTE